MTKLSKAEEIKLLIRYGELMNIFHTPFRPSITDNPELWLELLRLHETLHAQTGTHNGD